MERIDRLTSLRGFAAVWVMLFHWQSGIQGFDTHWLSGLPLKGYLAVDLFFVLSGFILAYSHKAEVDAGQYQHRRFLLLRLGRVYPVHLATLLLALCITWLPGFAEDWIDVSAAALFTNLALIHAWGIHDEHSWNFVSWSISAEWFAYLLFPWLLATSRLARSSAACLTAATACIMLLGALVWLLLAPGFSSGSLDFVLKAVHGAPFNFSVDYAPLRVTLEFLAGLFLFRAYDSLRLKDRRWAAWGSALSICALGYFLHQHWSRLHILQDTFAVLCMAALILTLALDARGVGRVLENRVLVFLGECSYSIYMMHGVVMIAYLYLLHGGALPLNTRFSEAAVVAAILTALSVAGGIFLNRYVENPARHAVRRWLRGRTHAT